MSVAVAALSPPPLSSLRRAAGSTDPSSLSHLLDRLHLDARSLDAHTDESGRSPLHHACWRGSLTNVQALLDLGCDLDAWSTGAHSYGKTPIFYAVTRCRDEVVQLLIARGARLRILNNKGQSVLSLASTHLSPRVVASLEAAEAAEGELPERLVARLDALPPEERPAVREAGWLDFHATHDDGQVYGDLDPRFTVAGPDDVVSRLAVNPTTREGRRLHKHLPGSRSLAWFPPRRDKAGAKADIDPTGRQLPRRRKRADLTTGAAPVGGVGRPGSATSAAELARALERALGPLVLLLEAGTTPDSAVPMSEVVDLATDVVTELASYKGAWLTAAALRIGRAGAPASLLREAADAASTRQGSNTHLVVRMLLQAASAPTEEEATRAAKAQAEAAVARERTQRARRAALQQAEVRRAARVAALQPQDAPAPRVVWVDSVEGVDELDAALSCALRVGVDTEWMDVGPGGSVSDAVVATVQFAVVDEGGREVAFVCDTRLDGDVAEHQAGDTMSILLQEYRRRLSETLRRVLLEEERPRAVGFAFAADAQKLARWLHAVGSCDGGGSALSAVELTTAIRSTTIDVQKLASEAGLGSRGQAASLQAVCRHWLSHLLSKDEQCSDWSVRPLSDRQMRYAAIDAIACLRVIDAMEADWGCSDAGPLHESL